MNFTLDQLLALDAIARTGTFAGAADELHKVPSAISYLVQGLESATDVDLFDRSRRKAVLTKAGQRILEASREVIEKGRALERVASELSGGWEAELHVIVDGALPISPITACLRRFADPEVPTCLRVDIEYQEGVIDHFNDAPADVALYLGFDSEEQAKGFDLTPLPDLDLMLVAAPEHPLAQVPFTDLARAGHAELVVRDSSRRFSDRAKATFSGSRNLVYLADFHSKRIALIDAAGYGWIPKHFVESDLKDGALVLLNAERKRWTYQPQLVIRENQPLGRAGQLFVDTLRSTLETLV
jgi:DNA-binding transcriptional LysR family regulator